MLKLADLASRADFEVGPLRVSPARRMVEGPAGTSSLEPIVMKVFLLLLDSAGSVVTRDDLFGNAWGGVYVGDDSLNRAIARLRKVAAETAPGLFEIETIPRTGYRITGAVLEHVDQDNAAAAKSGAPVNRRALIGGTAAAATLGAAGWWWLGRSGDDPRFDRLMERGTSQLARGEEDMRTVENFRQAAALRPRDAHAWGLLAYTASTVTEDVKPKQTTAVFDEAQGAAQNALSIDPREPNALTAVALIKEWIDGWLPFDQRLRHALAVDPDNGPALSALNALLQAAGLTREAWGLNERSLRLQPLSPVFVYRKALKLWIMGRTAESYKVIERASDLWPASPGVWNARLVILAFTNRAPAALQMLDDNPGMLGNPSAMGVWRASLAALQDRSQASVAAATKANLDAAGKAPGLAAHAAMVLGALDQVDAAYEVINGFLLSRGPILVRMPTTSKGGMITSRGWKWTQWLFTPVVASIRADDRFPGICDAVGLSEYWRSRSLKPDYLTQRD
jgi:DNA-binding winged helix-turn-helix (wHTH) protein/tetratricopeptide (TPR) repeat protein